MANGTIGSVMITQQQIEERAAEIARQIEKDFEGQPILLVGILKGAVMWMVDMMKNIQLEMTIDFMAVSSYGSSTRSSGVVKIVKDLDTGIEGRNVIIVEDIVDSGRTLSYLKCYLFNKGAKAVKICTLLDKPERRNPNSTITVDYRGFVIPNEFVVGYGLDYDEKYRNLPEVGVLKPEIYAD